MAAPPSGGSAAQRRLVGADRLGKAHHQGVGGQLVADRSLGECRQRRGQWRQVVEVQVVADVDDQTELGSARRGLQHRPAAGLRGCRREAAAA